MSLQGIIEEMGLGEVIQALSLNRHVGTLRIETEEGLSKFFYLSAGEIVLIRTVNSEPVRIGELLVRAGKISQDQLNEAIVKQKEGGGRLGDRVSKLFGIKGQDIEDVVRKKFEEEFLDIFLLDRGRFEFIFGLSPESLFSPDEKLERVSLNASGLMLEAMRRVDDWQTKLKEIGSLEEIFVNRMQSQGTQIENWKFEGVDLAPVARKEIYEAVDGKKTVREILAFAQVNGTSRLQAFSFVVAIKKNELIRPLKPEECLAYAKEAIEAKDPPGAAKYIRAVMSKGHVDLKIVQRYVDFLRKSARPQFAEREAKSIASQYQVRGDLDAAITLYRIALELDPRDTEVIDRLFYALLRKNLVKEAVGVGVRLREFLDREHLPLVARIVRNLKELDPEDARVLELSGILLKKQERLEEASEELKHAFSLVPATVEYADKRAELLSHLIELHPDRADLKNARTELVEGAKLARERAIRRRAAMLTGSIGAAFVSIWLTWGEIAARREFSQAEKQLSTALASGDVEERAKLYDDAALLFERVAGTTSTVAREGERRAAEVRKRVADERARTDERTNEAVIARKKREQEAEQERIKAERKAKIEAALDRISVARDRKQWEDAAKTALALFDDADAKEDPRVKALTVPARVVTTPPGAKVSVQGIESTVRTPCMIEVPARMTARLKVTLSGYTPVEDSIDGSGYVSREIALVRGPVWQHDLDAPASGPPLVAGDAIVVVDRAGSVVALDPATGNTSWAADAATAGIAAPPGASVAIAGGALVVGADGKAVALDKTGKPRGKVDLGGAAPIPATPLADGRVLFAREDKLVVVDSAKLAVVAKLALPGPAASPAGSDGDHAWVALVDGRLVCLDLATGKQAWVIDAKAEATGAPEPISALGIVVVSAKSGAILAFSAKNGALAYSVAPDGGLDAPLRYDGTRAFASSTTGTVSSIDLVQGRRGWSTRVGGLLPRSPVCVGKTVFVPTNDGDLVELDAESGTQKPNPLKLGAPPTAPGVLAGDRLIVPLANRVVAVERLSAE